jgi:hypothetical protein
MCCYCVAIVLLSPCRLLDLRRLQHNVFKTATVESTCFRRRGSSDRRLLSDAHCERTAYLFPLLPRVLLLLLPSPSPARLDWRSHTLTLLCIPAETRWSNPLPPNHSLVPGAIGTD